MNSDPETYNNILNDLKAGYVERLRGFTSTLNETLARLKDSETPFRREDAIDLHMLAHSLAGSGTTFGFPHVSKSAYQTEEFLHHYLKSASHDSLMNPANIKILENLLTALRNVCVHIAGREQSVPIPDSPALQSQNDLQEKRKFVLVIDDDPSLSTLLASLLEQENIQSAFCVNAGDALKMIAKQQPDLIILDIVMPGLSGHEVLTRLKQDPAMMAIPIVILSRSKQETDLLNSLRSGAIDFISKPFRPQELLDRIRSILQASEKKILIVDNDPMILHLLQTRFVYEGYNVLLAQDGQKGLDLIAKHRPDLVILDIIMPALDGTAVIHRMRQSPKTAKIPVLIMSTRSQSEDIAEGLGSGAQDYIAKPFAVDNLVNRARKLLEKTGS